MSKKIIVAAALLAAAAPLAASADSGPRASIGIGSYAVSIKNTDLYDTTDSFQGGALVVTLPLGDSLAVRGHIYSLKGAQDGKGTILSLSSVTLSGADAAILIGSNWGEGLNLYLGGGGYSEQFGISGTTLKSNKFTGGMAVFGIGYNGGSLALDLSVAARSATQYDKDLFLGTGNTTATSASLDLSFFF